MLGEVIGALSKAAGMVSESANARALAKEVQGTLQMIIGILQDIDEAGLPVAPQLLKSCTVGASALLSAVSKIADAKGVRKLFVGNADHRDIDHKLGYLMHTVSLIQVSLTVSQLTGRKQPLASSSGSSSSSSKNTTKSSSKASYSSKNGLLSKPPLPNSSTVGVHSSKLPKSDLTSLPKLPRGLSIRRSLSTRSRKSNPFHSAPPSESPASRRSPGVAPVLPFSNDRAAQTWWLSSWEEDSVWIPLETFVAALSTASGFTLNQAQLADLALALDPTRSSTVSPFKFASFLRRYGGFSRAIATVLEVFAKPYWAHTMTTGQVAHWMEGLPPGSFLLRLCDNADNAFSLDVVGGPTRTITISRQLWTVDGSPHPYGTLQEAVASIPLATSPFSGLFTREYAFFGGIDRDQAAKVLNPWVDKEDGRYLLRLSASTKAGAFVFSVTYKGSILEVKAHARRTPDGHSWEWFVPKVAVDTTGRAVGMTSEHSFTSIRSVVSHPNLPFRVPVEETMLAPLLVELDRREAGFRAGGGTVMVGEGAGSSSAVEEEEADEDEEEADEEAELEEYEEAITDLLDSGSSLVDLSKARSDAGIFKEVFAFLG